MEVEVILDVLNDPGISSTNIPAWISVCCKDDESLSSGEPVDEFIRLIASRQGDDERGYYPNVAAAACDVMGWNVAASCKLIRVDG
eukprot:753684-Hanusia_phi.AAC.5